jgi:hypothetical protein
MKNYYYILGLQENVTLDDIKFAYRKLSKKFHPDMNGGDKFFEDRFKDIQEAYEVLSDEARRKLYDIDLNSFIKVTSSGQKENTRENEVNKQSKTTKAKTSKSGYKLFFSLLFIILLIILLGNLVLFFAVDVMNLVDDTVESPKIHIPVEKQPYLHGVPPAPPYQDIEVTVRETVTEGCGKAYSPLIGYIIDIEEPEYGDTILIIQDEDGVRLKCYLSTSYMPMYSQRYLKYILIPGNKVNMQLEVCGSGGFLNIMKIIL